jgi:hypothetical protein
MTDPANITEDMIKQMERVAESLEQSVIAMKLSKAPQIWHIAEIATWIGRSYDHTRDRVVKMPDFPEQVPSGGWFADEVIEFYRTHKGKLQKAA